MSFGAIITSGDANAPLPAEVSQWLTEVRVEQELSKPTKFAIRFEDDLCGDEPAVERRPEIAANKMISVLVPDGNKTACLVRGRITLVKSSTQIGGQGSWVEAHGEDRKIEMDRETVQATWEGKEDKIVQSILQGYKFKPDVANVQTKTYSGTEQLNQRGTDLAMLDKIVAENGVDFWVDYEVKAPTPFESGYKITETAHFRISPEVPDKDPFSIAEFALSPLDADAPAFRVSVPSGDCPNVNTFRATVDTERPNRATGAAIDAASGETKTTDITADPSTTDEGQTLDGIDGVNRTIVTTGPGSETDQGRRDDAALREASWFVDATVSTTAHLLKDRIVTSHQIVNVEGAGGRFSIAYQIKSVTHVINAVHHVMDCALRANVIGTK